MQMIKLSLCLTGIMLWRHRGHRREMLHSQGKSCWFPLNSSYAPETVSTWWQKEYPLLTIKPQLLNHYTEWNIASSFSLQSWLWQVHGLLFITWDDFGSTAVILDLCSLTHILKFVWTVARLHKLDYQMSVPNTKLEVFETTKDSTH
jgi:hypothetical protein